METKPIQRSHQGPLIETIGITKVFHNGNQMVTAISDVSIKILAGDFIIIFGSSTSGKTTLFSVMSGMEKPDLGEVLIKGEPLYEFQENEINFLRNKKFAFIPQSKRWVSHLNLLDNVALPLIISGEKEKIAKNKSILLLEKYGLGRYIYSDPLSLSSVDQQIASIVRAIINDPWIIFVDEPYVSLTRASSDRVISLLKEINSEKGAAVLITTNDANMLRHSEKWVFMDEGKAEDIYATKQSIKRLKEIIKIVEQREQELKNKNVFNLSF